MIKDRIFLIITAAVLLMHALVFLSLNFTLLPPPPPLAKKLLVTTVKLKPSPSPPPLPKVKETLALTEENKPPPPQIEIQPEKEVEVKETPPPTQKIKEKKPPLEIQPKKEVKVKKSSPPPQPIASKPKVKNKKDTVVKNLKAKPALTKPSEKKPPAPVLSKIDPKEEAIKASQRKLLAKAREKTNKIDLAQDKLIATASLENPGAPSRIETLHIETTASLSEKELSYRNELAHRIKMLLKLPQYGDIQIKLTVDRSGNVLNMQVLTSESKENKSYIEKTLPKLKMPSFGDHFGGDVQQTFTITMSNEIQ